MKITIVIFLLLMSISFVYAQSIPGDDNGDGCVSLSEVSSYVGQWLNGQVTLSQVSLVVNSWLQGCSPSVISLSPIEYLGDDRAIDWNPGVEGGIPNYPNSNVDVFSYGAVGNGVADDTQAIKNALAAVPQGQALLLPAGQYKITSTIDIPSRRVLRGEGWDNTIVRCDAPNSRCFGIINWPGSVYVGMTGGYTKGSTQVQVASTSSISVGEYAELLEDVDFDIFVCGYNGCADSIPGWGETQVGQIVKVVAVDSSSNTITLERPLHFTYKANLNPRLRAYPKNEFSGIENLYLHRVNWDGYGSSISITGAANCWIKGVWSQYTLSEHVNLVGSAQCEIRDSIFNDAHLRGSGGQGYGVTIEGRATDNLIENSIFHKLRHSMIMATGANGNVFAYDYSGNPVGANSNNDTIDWLFPDISMHGHFDYFNLYEGNIASNALSDNVWGTNWGATWFRNKITRTSERVSANRIDDFPFMGISIGNFKHNIVGNELGYPGQVIYEWPGRYEIAQSGTGSTIIWVRNEVIDSTYVHGNYEYINGRYWLSNLHNGWDSNLGGENAQIPKSMIYESKPDWWPSNKVWPPFGPENIGSGNTIPAQDLYNQLAAQGKLCYSCS